MLAVLPKQGNARDRRLNLVNNEGSQSARPLAKPTHRLMPAGHTVHTIQAAAQANWATWELLC